MPARKRTPTKKSKSKIPPVPEAGKGREFMSIVGLKKNEVNRGQTIKKRRQALSTRKGRRSDSGEKWSGAGHERGKK